MQSETKPDMLEQAIRDALREIHQGNTLHESEVISRSCLIARHVRPLLMEVAVKNTENAKKLAQERLSRDAAVEKARREERERAAKVADHFASLCTDDFMAEAGYETLAAAIRQEPTP